MHIQRHPQTHPRGRTRANVRHGWSSFACGSGRNGPQRTGEANPRPGAREGQPPQASMLTKRIVVDADAPANARLRTLIHETMHALGVGDAEYRLPAVLITVEQELHRPHA